MTKLKKLMAVILSLTFMICMFNVPASAAVTATALTSDTKTAVLVKAGSMVAYKFSMAEEGDFTLDMLYERAAWASITIVDADTGEIFPSETASNKRGTGGYDINNKYQFICWEMDSAPHNYQGTIKYHLPAGLYYMKLKVLTGKEALTPKDYEIWKKDDGNDRDGKFTFTATYKSADPEIDCITISLKKGTTIQLGALMKDESSQKVKWSTSKKTVASVTSKGKVTAKSTGTAVITAKIGKSTSKIQIIVTK